MVRDLDECANMEVCIDRPLCVSVKPAGHVSQTWHQNPRGPIVLDTVGVHPSNTLIKHGSWA